MCSILYYSGRPQETKFISDKHASYNMCVVPSF